MADMTWISKIWAAGRCRQVAAAAWGDLASIIYRDVNLVYLKRPVDADIEQHVQHLVDTGFAGINQCVTPDDVGAVLRTYLPAEAMPASGKTLLTEDILLITRVFFSVTGAHRLRLILKVVSDDACRKFHTDAYPLRLLCTYLGPGPEWVEDSNVNRRKLVHGRNDEIIQRMSEVKTMAPFDVAILKGEPQSNRTGRGIVHRSPPLQHGGEKRLLLRLDMMADTTGWTWEDIQVGHAFSVVHANINSLLYA